MKNNKGQALIIFVLFLPLFILGITYVFDMSRITYEKNKITSIGHMAIDVATKDEELTTEGIKQLIKMNDSDIKVSINTNDGMKIQLIKEVNSLFSRIVGKDKYTIKVVVEKE